MVTNEYVGQTLNGFCAGAFGRDSYDEKIVLANGVDWIVVRDTDGVPLMAVIPLDSEPSAATIVEGWIRGES